MFIVSLFHYMCTVQTDQGYLTKVRGGGGNEVRMERSGYGETRGRVWGRGFGEGRMGVGR